MWQHELVLSCWYKPMPSYYKPYPMCPIWSMELITIPAQGRVHHRVYQRVYLHESIMDAEHVNIHVSNPPPLENWWVYDFAFIPVLYMSRRQKKTIGQCLNPFDRCFFAGWTGTFDRLICLLKKQCTTSYNSVQWGDGKKSSGHILAGRQITLL